MIAAVLFWQLGELSRREPGTARTADHYAWDRRDRARYLELLIFLYCLGDVLYRDFLSAS